MSLGVVPAFNHDMTLRFATGIYYQAPFFKELRDTATVNGITVATLRRDIKSQRSIHFIAGLDYRFTMKKRPYKFTAEAYYKALSNIVPYTVDNVKIVYDASQQCSGHAMGLDLKLYGEFVPGTDSWVSLSLMDTKIGINGKSIPLPTDQRYSLNLFLQIISRERRAGVCLCAWPLPTACHSVPLTEVSTQCRSALQPIKERI